MKQHLQKQHPQMGKWLKCIYKIIWKLYNYTSYKFHDGIVIDGYIFTRRGKWTHNNLGDDLNIPLIEELTGKKIFLKKDVGVKRHLLCIGSIIESYTSADSIIWGSGAMFGTDPITHKPAKVYAVRGLLTKNYLESQGVKCPDIFGDPAILMPLVYLPKSTKKYKLGIIPHIIEQEHPLIINLKSRELCDVCIIDFKNYSDWHSVIDLICSCERILSSSLHGLIISNAYGIPNKWMKLSDKILGGYFKFLDYFSAISNTVEEPVDLSEKTSIPIEELLDYSYKTYNIKKNVHDLIESCPFLSAKKKKIYTQSISAVYHDCF